MNNMALKLGDPLQEYLDVHFLGLCGMGFFEFLSHGYITSIHVCRDLLWRSPEDYLFRAAYKQSSQTFTKNGLGTINFGKSSGNQVTIYDKAAQMSKGKATHSTIRVEAKLRLKKTKISALWSMANPFTPIGIYSLTPVKKTPGGPSFWIAFKDACRYRGISKAIAMQPPSLRPKLRKAIAQMPVTWWQMSEDHWPERLSEALADCWLNRIPDNAPPLTLAKLVAN